MHMIFIEKDILSKESEQRSLFSNKANKKVVNGKFKASYLKPSKIQIQCSLKTRQVLPLNLGLKGFFNI